MTTDLPPVPPAVIEFAENNTQKIIFVRDWNNYKVYTYDYSKEPNNTYWGLPVFILYDGKNVKFANEDEQSELMHLNNHQ